MDTANVNIPRPQLEEALHRVQQGLMQPDEAARWLMQCIDESQGRTTTPGTHASNHALPLTRPPQATPPHRSTVADLMNQLGPPPLEIQQDWDRQLAIIAAEFQRTHGEPLPELSASDLLVDDENRLALSSHIRPRNLASRIDALPKQTVAPAISTSTAMPPATIPHAANHSAITSEPHTEPFSLAPVMSEVKQDAPPRTATTRKQKSASRFGMLLAKHPWKVRSACAIGFGLLLLGTLYSMLGPSGETSLASNDQVSSTPKASDIFSPTAVSQDREKAKPENAVSASRETQEPNPSDLTLLEPNIDGDSPALSVDGESPPPKMPNASSEQNAAPDHSALGLSTFGEGEWVSADQLAPAAEFDIDTTESNTAESEVTSDSGVNSDDATDESAESEMELPEDEIVENDSPTEPTAALNAIQLPPMPLATDDDSKNTSLRLVEDEVNDVSLWFPTTTDIALERSGNAWEFKATKDQTTIAQIEVQPSNEGNEAQGLFFRWASDASRHAVARQLTSGLLSLSLKDGTERPLFLRASLTADAWPIDFSRGDVKAAWPISIAPPVGPTSLSINFKVPEKVVLSWIEPLDETQVRRNQSICQFALESDDTIAIRSRIDLRTGSRIQLRMRHAAQLDPSYPWQMISTDHVDQAMAQVTDHLERANFEAGELKSAYYEASTMEKKIIGPRRDAIDSIVLRLKTLNERLSKFDQLLAQLDQKTEMMIQLQVKWPETSPLATQTIFEMKSRVTEE
jgi:hypothetical protein